MLLKLLEAALERRSGWSCGDKTENCLHHNYNRSGGLVRHEELTQVTMEAVAELLRPIISRELMTGHLSARSGAIGLLRKPDFPSLRVL